MMIKKKKWFRTVGMLLTVAMTIGTFAGCGNGIADGETASQSNGVGTMGTGGTSGGKGRFMESEITLPEGVGAIMAMEKLADDSIEMYTQGDAYSEEGRTFVAYRSTDQGKNWEMLPIQHTETISPEGAIIDKNGNVTALFLDVSEEDSWDYTLKHIATDGSIEEKELISPEGEELILGMAVTNEGVLFVQYLDGNIYKVEEETGKVKLFCDLEGKNSTYFDVVGNRIFAVTADGILQFDSTSGDELEGDEVLNNLILSNSSLAYTVSDRSYPLVFAEGGVENDIAYATGDGVFYHKIGGSVSEELVNGNLTSLADGNFEFVKLIMISGQQFLVQGISSDGKIKLYSYLYDSEASATPETELKVYALEETALLRQTITTYQKTYPDAYVNLQIGLSGDDGMTVEDALRSLSTEILAGNGPDVLILDGMPVDSYIEKGILCDISDVVKNVSDKEGLFENIVSAYEKDGAIYGIPSRYYFNAVGGDAGTMSAKGTLENLVKYGETLKIAGEKDLLSYATKRELAERLYQIDAANWKTTNGQIDEVALKQWLALVERYYLLDEREDDADVVAWNEATQDGNSLSSSMSTFSVLIGENRIALGTLVSINDIVSTVSAKDQSDVDYGLVGGETGKTFLPYNMMGIVNSTKEMDAAKAFVETALSAECGEMSESGFPINRMAYAAQCEMATTQYTEEAGAGVAISTDEGAYIEVNYRNLTEGEVKDLTDILESLDTPADMDRVVWDIVLDQTERFLNGNQTIDETVSNILQKCNLYLAE